LSEVVDEEEAAGAAGVDVLEAGVLAESPLDDEAPASLEEPAELPESLLLSLLDGAGLALPYPSAYQPPPLKAMAGAVMTRSSLPPQ
jgi:hypothetical protein